MKNKPLIYNSDIKFLSKKDSITADEMLLIPFHNALETKIQTYCHNLLKTLAFDLERKYNKKVVEFVQFDNGDTSAGKLKPNQAKALFSRKKREGSKRGFFDSGIFMGTPCGKHSKVILVEFKRIGSPSQIHITPEQQNYHDWFNSIGFEAHITNNPLYFREVILKSVRDFYKIKE